MKFTVGIFVLSLLLSIMFFLYLLLKEKGSFEDRYNYYFHTYSAASFYIGMPLKFSGFNIGTIDDIALQNDGSVNMTFSVNEKNRKWISKDSVLLLRKPLIGAPHIELFTALDNPVLEIDSRLTLIMSDDIDDMISKLEPAIDRVIHIINNVDTITSYIAKEDSELMLTLQNIRKLSDKLAHDDSLLTSLTGDKQASKSIISSLKQTDKIMKDIQKVTATLHRDIIEPSSSAVKDLDYILKDVKKKLNALDATVNAIGSYDKDLIHLKEQISAGLEKSNQIMDKIDSVMQNEKSSEVTLP
jgi:phospholipid/cholesterol/gamma-HCH transport system substrate-binding protein